MSNFFKKAQENQDYINYKVNPLIERLYKDILIEKPVEPIEFIISWMQKEKLGQNKPQSFPLMQRIQFEPSALNPSPNLNPAPNPYLPPSQSKPSASNNPKKNDPQTPSESGESEDEEETKKKLAKLKDKPTGSTARTSVSAEVYGAFNKKGQFVPKVIPKTEDQSRRIQEKLQTVWMFSGLGPTERETLIKVMEEKRFKKNELVIKQGDKYGQHLFVVDSGELDCYKELEGSKEVRFLKKYKPGEAFGELALLYNAPRAASIKCVSNECVLFALDREAFNHIVREATVKKREKYEKLLEKIDLLKNIDSYEKMQIIDALKPAAFKKGEFVIKQGDEGNSFYFIESGSAIATKSKSGAKPEKVMEYHVGDYFGELALLKNEPRAANVLAETDLNLLSLDRDSFNRLLGPLDEIMRREMGKYR